MFSASFFPRPVVYSQLSKQTDKSLAICAQLRFAFVCLGGGEGKQGMGEEGEVAARLMVLGSLVKQLHLHLRVKLNKELPATLTLSHCINY